MYSKKSVAKRLWLYLKPYWPLSALTFLVMMVLAVLTLALPAAVQYMIDDLIPGLVESAADGVDWAPALMFGLVLVGIYFLRLVFTLLQDYLSSRIGASIVVDIRSVLFAHLERVSFSFYQRRQLGEIVSRLLSDVARIQSLLSVTVLYSLYNALLLIGILVYLLNVDWALTLVALAPVPLTILFSNYLGGKAHKYSKRQQEAYAAVQGQLLESLSGLRTIRAFGQEKSESVKVDNLLGRLRGLLVKNAVVNSVAGNVVFFVNMLGPVIVLVWGVYLIAEGNMKLGALMAFYMLLAYLYNPVQELASINVAIQSAMASVYRVFEYLDLPPGIDEAPEPVALQNVKGAIKLENVSYRHDGSGFALKDISLDIRPGETVAIVGPSGSGKTTLINLVMRFFDPHSGRVTIDGVDLRHVEIKTLRRLVGLVDQEPTLFKMSIRENIAFANPKADLELVEKAARVANIHDFIVSQKGGYDSEIGERGVTVSGGEKQRLCLARAVMNDPPIMLLDEATSSLDSNSEELIQQALNKLLVKKTAIIVAHRLATVRHADRIVLMDGGQIVDEGTHDDLLSNSPLYRELANKQMLL